MFPRGDLGYEIIQSHRYLLHKAEDFADVLCNSPANIPIIDAIKPKQRVMISAIFKKLKTDDRVCPKCRHRRVANFQGPALEWYVENMQPVALTLFTNNSSSGCDLWLRFHDSYSDEPDLLTQIAINNIKSSGKAEFATNYLGSTGPARDDSVDVRILIRDKMAQIGPIPPERSKATRPEIWHFSRVTLCNSQWPQFSDSTSRETASRLLVETRQGLERTTQFLKSQDLPFAWAAALINSRFWFARQEQALLRFVTSSLQALDHTMPRVVTPQNDAQLLDNLVYQLQAGIFDFLPERLEARCFL